MFKQVFNAQSMQYTEYVIYLVCDIIIKTAGNI